MKEVALASDLQGARAIDDATGYRIAAVSSLLGAITALRLQDRRP
jgi:hypothetical protein